MTATRSVPLAAILGFVLSLCAPVLVGAAPIQSLQTARKDIVLIQASANVSTSAQIYLVRGLANVFSRGMDEMGAKLRGYGFSPHVINWRGSESAVATIARNYRAGQAPVILIGHSLGANAVLQIAAGLNKKNIPVAYVATFDPTRSLSVPGNVQSFVNFFQRNGQGRSVSFPASRGDDKANVDLTSSPGLSHTNIDQSTRLQDIVIAKVLRVTAK